MIKRNRLRHAILIGSALGTSLAMSAAASAQVTASAPTPAAQPTSASAGPVRPFSDSLSPSWGNIRSFWGDNTPFWGNIRSFWGDTGPYADDLTPFWGNIRSFNATNTDSALYPQWGNIRSFAGDIGASWGNIRSFWGNIRSFQDDPQDYTQLSAMLSGMVTKSDSVFGPAVQAQTGQSFDTAFANPLLAKYGIDLTNPQSLANLDASTREHFFMDWWDGLMNYSGADHVDHWMPEINWTPALTQTLGSGQKTTIGVLDFTITGEAADNVIKYDGVSNVANGHGAAVASLLVDPMDGKGVMGIAPHASVVEYNPFDATQTASWADITHGVAMLTKNGATIINMSLGVPGWTLNPGWDQVFQDKSVKPTAAKQVFVVAAGNDGIVQTQNVAWHPDNPQLIVVGSVDPTGTISSFSNQPGGACFTDPKGKCSGDYLMNHFIVAPGELILVSDGHGGTTRLSGTSFAAPLVSGTIALIQDRWPWLTDHPKDTTNIILSSAKDLGAPGIDPVYGVGELDVLAALSPLDWNKLTIKQSVNGKIVDVPINSLQGASTTQQATWETNSVYLSLFEKTGESYRDFEVPLSSKLTNQTVSIAGNQEQFMGYLTSRFLTWVGNTGTQPGPAGPGAPPPPPHKFTDLNGVSEQFVGFAGAHTTVTMRPSINRPGFKSSGMPYETAMSFSSPDQQFTAEFGNSGYANSVAAQSGFAMRSDYDPAVGGANPFIGLASGGAYTRAQLRLAPGLNVATAFTERSLERDLNGLSVADRQALAMQPYRASAENVSLSYQASSKLKTSFAYTLLHEDDAILGMASAISNGRNDGSTTDSATFGADYALTRSLSLAASATMGRTRAGDTDRSTFAVGRGGLMSSAFQVSVSKDGVFDGRDRLHVTFAQPMHVERGKLDVSSVGVIDRLTGELGPVVQTTDVISPTRYFVSEMIYGRQVARTADVSLFGRTTMNAQSSQGLPGLMGGASFHLAF